MTTNSQLKQLLFVGLACTAFVVVVNVARSFRADSNQNDSTLAIKEDSDGAFSVRTVDAELPERDRPGQLSHAVRIPSVDRSTDRFPIQPATFDSIAWDSQVETVNRIPVEEDSPTGARSSLAINLLSPTPESFARKNSTQQTLANPKTELRVAGLSADGVNLKPYKPPAKPPTAEFANGNGNQNQALPVRSQKQSAPQNRFAFGPSPNLSEPRVIFPNSASVEVATEGQTAQQIVNPYAVNSNSKRGVYPLTDTLEIGKVGKVGVDELNSDSTTVIKNRYFSQDKNTLTKNEFVQSMETTALNRGAALRVDSNSDESATPKLTNLPLMESSGGQFEAIEKPENEIATEVSASTQFTAPPTQVESTASTDNDFVPRVANANPVPNSPAPTQPPTPVSDDSPSVLRGADKFVLAEQPKLGDHWKDDRPTTDQRASLINPIKNDFSPDPIDQMQPYDPYQQMNVYEGKTLNANQRPILELGRPWYQLGQLSPGYSWFGKHNNITPQLLVYGDVRTAAASNTQNGNNVSQIAFEVNLDFDLKLTGTERFHMFMSPLDDGRNTRWLLDDDEFVDESDADIDFGYFEGDMGAIVGGLTNRTLPFDMPFAVGVMPLLLQNGVWFEDAFLGVATTLPARSSAKFNISNMDTTFFAGYDKINSDAFIGDDSAARMYGVASFIEAMNGYFEIDYAFLDDRTFNDQSYHNFGFAYSRRFGRLLSNSTRVIVNAGQSTDVVENSADGVLLLSENSLITSSPSTLVPYMNFFAGFDRPQSAARAAAAGGVLRNTGILFESDGMTNYPTLDATANDTYGGAFGINLLADDFSQQLVVEMAMLGVMGEDANRNAAGSQYGVGFRYQLPLTNAIILRADGMYGFLEDDHDVRGIRLELRHKY